ncbi:MAG: Lsr2 family protein, partial [Actinobacteria bacterium]|nr:Lsr2 family protein [Actinomycetota bacterium]
MAKTTVTLLTCDRCSAETGEDIEVKESVGFAYDGYSYALDLCPPHAENFHTTVQTMIGWSSERTRAGAGRRSRRATPSSPKAEPGATS